MSNKYIFLLIMGLFINISSMNDCEDINKFNYYRGINSKDFTILEVEKIINETIKYKKFFIFKEENYTNNLLVTFYSINCDIQIHINDTYDFEKINNIRDNNSFSIRIKSDEIENITIKVLHLTYLN